MRGRRRRGGMGMGIVLFVKKGIMSDYNTV
jgi:hypothetical protein